MSTVIATIADGLTLRVEARRLPPSPVAVLLPMADAFDDDDGENIGNAEGQSFVIEYVDSAGAKSTRRITVWGIKRGAGGVPLLVAKCHERQRTVTFRTDRISACIDYDGEVFSDVPGFLFETFGMPLDVGRLTSDRKDQEAWDGFRQMHLPQIILLSALSHADMHMLPEEIGVIVDYVAAEARRLGIDVTEAFRRIAAAYIRRLRPRRIDLEISLNGLQPDRPDAIIRFLRAAAEVVDADGFRHPDEIDMINRLSEELIGVPVYG